MAHYPGKQKLIASGFHEACLAAYGVYKITKGQAATFAYTTTSKVVHDRLGVTVDLEDL